MIWFSPCLHLRRLSKWEARKELCHRCFLWWCRLILIVFQVNFSGKHIIKIDGGSKLLSSLSGVVVELEAVSLDGRMRGHPAGRHIIGIRYNQSMKAAGYHKFSTRDLGRDASWFL